MALVSQTFNASGTWVCPAGVFSLYQVEAVGMGGTGGAGNGASGGGGGGGGAYAKTTVPGEITVTPGNSYTITIGTAGSPGLTTFTGDGGKYLSADWAANASGTSAGDKGYAIYCASNVTFVARDGHVGLTDGGGSGTGGVGAASGWFDEYGSGGDGGTGGVSAGNGGAGNIGGGGGGGGATGTGGVLGAGRVVLTWIAPSVSILIPVLNPIILHRYSRLFSLTPSTTPQTGSILIDFGTTPANYTFADISYLGNIPANATAEAFVMMDSTVDHNDEEHKILAGLIKLTCSYSTQYKGFRIHAYLPNSSTTGVYNVRWVWVP